MKKFHLGLIIIVGLLSGCSNCGSSSGNTPLVSSFLGKWKLIQINGNNTNQSNFSYEEILSIEAVSGNPWELERIYRNKNEREVKEWNSYSEICKENSVLVQFSNGFQRKYWLTNYTSDPLKIQATGYVKQIGGTDDTLRYFYERVQ